jgi:hypothetical protein
MATIRYQTDREIPLIREADVVVVGGGPGGIGAAVMAARAGARTLLVERYSCPGGMAVSGEVHPFMPNHHNGEPLDGPVYTDWLEAMDRYAPRSDKLAISKEAAMLAAEDLCLSAGVQLLYHHQLADVVMSGRKIQCLVLLSKSGHAAVRGEQYVDCTGDADLAAMAGCSFEQGGPSGHCQPMTLCFKLSHVDRARVPWKELTKHYHEARERGEIDCPREDVLHFSWIDDDVVHFNTTRIIHKSGTNGPELSEAEVEGRRQVRQFVDFLHRNVPGFENARIHSIAQHIGVRETRRVKGTAYLTVKDYEACRKFPDAICRVNYPIDIHNPDGTGTVMNHLPEGEWYEIPYGCVVAADVDNLLVGGRPISVDHAVHSSMRVMPPACTIGQACGMAGAMACRRGFLPRQLDGVEVRNELKKQGARL